MYSKKIFILLCVVIPGVLSCSHCYIAQNSFETLENEKNIRLEVHTNDGDVFSTRDFYFADDTLHIQDHSTAFNKTEVNVPNSSIKYINVCELNTEKGKKQGYIFVACILGLVIIYLWSPLNLEPW